MTSVSLLVAERVAERGELGDQLLVVVDLAVEDDRDAAVLVEQRLLAGGDVDDRKPAVAEPDARLEVQPAAVRAAMVLRLVHAVEQVARDLAAAARVEDACESAHGRVSCQRGAWPPATARACRAAGAPAASE